MPLTPEKAKDIFELELKTTFANLLGTENTEELIQQTIDIVNASKKVRSITPQSPSSYRIPFNSDSDEIDTESNSTDISGNNAHDHSSKKICEIFTYKKYTYKQIANIYKICEVSAYRIITGRSWKWLE